MRSGRRLDDVGKGDQRSDSALEFLIADDHELYRRGLKYTLIDAFPGLTTREAGSLDSALDIVGRNDFLDIAIFDLQMPGMRGGPSLRAVRHLRPDLRIVVLSATERRETILEALGAGVHGYIPKSFGTDELIGALRDVLAGRLFVPSILADVARSEGVRPAEDVPSPLTPNAVAVGSALTPRQREVLGRLIAGRTTKEIARDLDLALGTVKIHLAAIFRVLDVRNRTEAAARAAALGLTSTLN